MDVESHCDWGLNPRRLGGRSAERCLALSVYFGLTAWLSAPRPWDRLPEKLALGPLRFGATDTGE
jgi:hypothetical protein